MKRKQRLILGMILLYISCKSQVTKINGLSFVASPKKITSKHIIPVKRVAANYVSLMPFGFIESINTPVIQFNTPEQWFGETIKGVEQYANAFKKEQISLMIKPQLWVWHGKYTGLIAMTSEEKWQQLERSYTKFIMAYATLAQQLDAAIFCIGTELEQFVLQRPEYWRRLIASIKKVYEGKITYAANWDEYKRVPFWNHLDFIGIDAYFPLSDKKSPTKEDFIRGWQPHKKEIMSIKEKFTIPVLFTEYGYRSVYYTGKEPWNSTRVEGNVDVLSQKIALEAIYEEFWKAPWFAGGFLWKWFSHHENVGGKANNQFTPQHKPAEEVIKKGYEK